MLKKCPRCGVQYTKEALEMFETTVKAGFTINLTCGNCGAAMVIDEGQVASGTAPTEAVPAQPRSEGAFLNASIGIETLGGRFTAILERGASLPCSRTEIFSTAADNQPTVEIHVFRGDGKLTSDAGMLDFGTYKLEGIPPALRGVPQIKVTFSVTEAGDFRLNATDASTGRSISSIKSRVPTTNVFVRTATGVGATVGDAQRSARVRIPDGSAIVDTVTREPCQRTVTLEGTFDSQAAAETFASGPLLSEGEELLEVTQKSEGRKRLFGLLRTPPEYVAVVKCPAFAEIIYTPSKEAIPGQPDANRPQHAASHPLLTCPLCGEVYLVGQDACIISLGDVFGFMAGQGTAIIGDADGMMGSTPDLVGRILPSWSKGEREERLRETGTNVDRIRNMIKSGKKPQWQCHACQDKDHPNPYPENF